MSDVTRILAAVEAGDPAAAEKLLTAVYEELRAMAVERLAREAPGHSLQATSIVHEAWMRLGGADAQRWERRAHFFAAAAEAMRRILIDRARARGRAKRGGNWKRINITSVNLAIDQVPDGLLELDDALAALAVEHPEKAELVKLRFFSGLPMREAASLLDISLATAERHWTYARAFLFHEMSQPDGASGD